jgi:hypothetical protein
MIKNRNTPGSRCSAEGNRIFTVFQRYHVHVTVLTMTHVKGDMGSTTGESTSVSECIKCALSNITFQFSPVIGPISLFKFLS